MASHRIVTFLGCAFLASPAWAQDASPPDASAPAPTAKQQETRPAVNSPLALLKQLDEGFVELFNRVAPSVVIIDTVRKSSGSEDPGDAYDFFFRSPDSDRQKHLPQPDPSNQSEASGFIVRQDGVIVTNYHVIEDSDKISVRLKDGRRFPAKIVGVDERTDIAVIKIDAKGLPPVELGDSDTVRTGQLVGAIGIPFSLDYSFSLGVVSGKGRSNLSSILTYEDYIQTDAFINPGNSGGPLFDTEGRVIGMNTLINGIGRNLAFAIPSRMIKEVTDQIITTGRVRYPWLGIRMETLQDNSSLREQIQGIDKGVVINTIEPDTPAYRSDLRPADVITSIDGVPISTARDLQKQVVKKKIGQTVQLTVWRGNKTLTIPITTGELPAMASTTSKESPTASPTPKSTNIYGLTLKEIDKEAMQHFGLKHRKGALISVVTPKSPASVAELKEGDVITEINSIAVDSAAAALKILQEHDPKKAILLIVERNGQKTYAVLKSE